MASQAKAPTRDDLEHVPLPGLGEDFMQDSDYPIAEDWYASAMTVRERTMLSLMLALKDKPEWDRKVFDEEIVGKWRAEALEFHPDHALPEGNHDDDPWLIEQENGRGINIDGKDRQKKISGNVFDYVSRSVSL